MKTTKLCFLTLLFALGSPLHAEEAAKPSDQPLKIVFLLGQSNMVGMAKVDTAWYLTQPQYQPPIEAMVKRSKTYDWTDLYWAGIQYFDGAKEDKDRIGELMNERSRLRSLWRSRIRGNAGPWQESWGKEPKLTGGRNVVDAWLNERVTEAGIFKEISTILDKPDNKFTPEKAYAEIIGRDERNKEQITRAREIYLPGTKSEDFDTFHKAVAKSDINQVYSKEPEKDRATYAALAKEFVHLPIAEHTWISAFGSVAGSTGSGIDTETKGPLSIGYGSSITSIGPEYGVGITLDKLTGGPVLLVKCAWGNTTLASSWRPGSLGDVETPIEKASREAWNQQETKDATEQKRKAKLREAPANKGKPGWCWQKALPHIRKVLANPGDYCPAYDPAKGAEIAGMVWFQGYSDMDNEAYGEELVEMIKWFRSEIKAPKMPVVCGSLGVGTFQSTELTGNVSGGMVYASNQPDLKGTVSVVNTGRFYPSELEAGKNILSDLPKDDPQRAKLADLIGGAVSNKGFHYMGSAKFHILAGDAMARSLVGLWKQ